MASSRDYLEFILEQLSDLDEITYRGMMGEFIIYYRGKILGGIYDDRFMMKSVKTAVEMLPGAMSEEPYPGAKPMLLIEDVDNKAFLTELIEKVYDELPYPKSGKH